MAGTLNDISKGVASATGSDLIGNLAANIAAGVGGAAVGGTAGAAMGSNVHLYNQTVDDERALTGESGRKTRTLADWGLDGLKLALGLLPSIFGGGMPPPSNPGMVVADSSAANAMLGTAGSLPANAIIAKGSQASNGNDANDSMLGANGPRVDSKTIWKGDGKERIDVENPNPGQRPGQIHY